MDTLKSRDEHVRWRNLNENAAFRIGAEKRKHRGKLGDSLSKVLMDFWEVANYGGQGKTDSNGE